jgi:hypothetical protein
VKLKVCGTVDLAKDILSADGSVRKNDQRFCSKDTCACNYPAACGRTMEIVVEEKDGLQAN